MPPRLVPKRSTDARPDAGFRTALKHGPGLNGAYIGSEVRGR
jgi:hypothetical protein